MSFSDEIKSMFSDLEARRMQTKRNEATRRRVPLVDSNSISQTLGKANDMIGRGVLAPLLGAIPETAHFAKNIPAYLGMGEVDNSQPLGGIEWQGNNLRDMGLIGDYRNPTAELGLSLFSPLALEQASVRTPQIANAVENVLPRIDELGLMPRAKQGQLGAIIVKHASPHEFDIFKAMDNIGGGEGAQAYGHGGYHSTGDLVHKNYLESVAPSQNRTAMQYRKMYGDRAADVLESEITPNLTPEAVANQKQVIDLLRSGKRLEANSYTNELRWPDPAREAADPLSDKHFLDWDKPLSEQDASVQALLPDFSGLDRPVTSLQGRIRLPDSSFADSEQQLSRALSARGIPGIRYLDGGSRSAGQGSHNYVTFDDALVNILERNGQPVGKK